MNGWMIAYIAVASWLASFIFSVIFAKFAAGESWRVVFFVATGAWLTIGALYGLVEGGIILFGTN